jgi:hypothetical protein
MNRMFFFLNCICIEYKNTSITSIILLLLFPFLKKENILVY